jgi:type III secretion protein V
MKFVKGDAIAGIIVLAVNVVGGLVIGVLQRDMELAAAARVYTVLTIGEGLVAQIPALLVSTAAGIIVTRVASEEQEEGADGAGASQLGREMARQVLAQPKALAIAAAMLALLAVVPGLPAAPFLALAAALGAIAWRLLRAPAPAAATAAVHAPSAGAPRLAADAAPPSPVLTPIAVEVAPDLAALLVGGGVFAGEVVPRARDRLFAELGLALPAVRLRADDGLPAGAFVLRLNEVPLARGTIVPEDQAAAGARLVNEILALMRRYGHELVGVQETQALLDGLERTHPALVREVVPKLVSPVLLADVLRRLVEEGISLRNLRDVLGALAEWAPRERDPVVLAEHVRAALRRAITFRHVRPGGVLPAYLLDGLIEDAIREAIHKTATGSYLALEPQLSRDIVAAVTRALGPDGMTGTPNFVLLTNAEIRRYVRRLVETAHPDLAVLSYQELAPEAEIRPLGRISIG